MIVKIDIGGTYMHCGELSSPYKPVPFYPYLLAIDPVRQATGDETASASFILSLQAQELLNLTVRNHVEVLDNEGNTLFSGVMSKLVYTTVITCSAEA